MTDSQVCPVCGGVLVSDTTLPRLIPNLETGYWDVIHCVKCKTWFLWDGVGLEAVTYEQIEELERAYQEGR